MVTNDTLRRDLSDRIPGADFVPYFAFIESRPVRDQKDSERHHILPKREFPGHVKNPDNLIYLSVGDHLRAHYWLALCAPECLSFQRTFFLMSAPRKAAKLLTPEEVSSYAEVYERGRAVQKVHAVALGVTQGRINIKNGHLDRVRPDPEVNRIQGLKNAQSGHLDRIRTIDVCVKGGKAAGKKAVENGHLKHASAIAGQKNKESGWAAELGRRAVESGQLRKVTTPESRAKGGRSGNHARWHVNRTVINPDCGLCQGVQNG